jgi:hypothetical protein
MQFLRRVKVKLGSGMREWEEKAERIWKSWPISILLCSCGAFFALWAWCTLPVPGVSIAILGLVAAIMSLRGEMRPLEKAAWMLIISVLLVAEIKSIRSDRTHAENQAKAERSAQDAAFELVLKKEDAQLQETLQGFDTVASLARRSIENETGGDSFAYLTPQMGFTPIPVSIYNYGKNTLTGVIVTIYPPAQGFDNFINSHLNPLEIEVGTLHPAGPPRILKYNINPSQIKSTVEFRVEISAQNFTVTQHMWFKPGVHTLLVYRTLVEKQYIKSVVGKTTYFGYKKLFQSDWTKD